MILMPASKRISMDEILLWKHFQEGNKDAFNLIIKTFYNEMYSYGFCFTKDTGLLKDSIQDVFLALWKSRLTIGNTSQINFYLLKSLRRRLAENIKANHRYSLKSAENFDELFDFQLNKEDAIVQEESLQQITRQLRNAIGQLTKRQQEIIYLRFYNDAGCNEIADAMGLTHQAVYNLLHIAISRLKEINTKTNSPAIDKNNGSLLLLALLANYF